MAASLVNGFSPSAPSNLNEVHEYEKILKLRDEIFAGTHPRLTVPAHAIRKVSPLSAASTGVPPPFPAATQQSQLPGLSIGVGDDKLMNTEPNVNNRSAAPPQLAPATASGIDPVLLMKSDELVKAETQLHRQRLEKALRDQFEQKRLDARKRPALGEAKPDFDITAVFAKALEVVKPDMASTPKDDASNSDGYDDNSLYSSKDPDSTPEVGELEDSASSQNHKLSAVNVGANDPAETRARFERNVSAGLPLPPPPPPPPPPQQPLRARSPPAMPNRPLAAVDLAAMDNDEEEEEGEYSPPEAVEHFANSGNAGSQTMVDPRTRPLRRYSEIDDNGKGPGSPNDHGRINTRNRPGRPTQRSSRIDQSPDGSGQGLHPRKKRKLDKKADRRRRNGGSPDIKDEPVSPPPFHDVQPLGSTRMRPLNDDRPIIIDDGPVREVRYVQAPDPYSNSPMRPVSRQADPMMPLTEPRVMSRSAMRPMCDDADLRRVASMHNMRPEPPREYIEQAYESPSRARAASYVRVDSPMRMEPPRMVQDIPPPPGYEREANQGVRVARSPVPQYREVYRESEPEVRYIPEPIAPPTVERIVVDQYGRRFREIIQDRASAAPRPYSTYPDRGQQPLYYENYDRSRGQSVVVETRQDPRTERDMLPPPPTAAAASAAAPQLIRQTVDPTPGYREVYEPLGPQRSVSMRPVEQASRQSVYIDDRAEYRAPVRVESVRPTGARYEEMAPPMVARAGSVRPGVREGSVFVDDRSQVRREYLPVETPRYRVVEPETRYVDVHGREITYVEGGQEAEPRYVQRY